MSLRPTRLFTLCLAIGALTSCAKNDAPATEELVHAASLGDEGAMQWYEKALAAGFAAATAPQEAPPILGQK